MSDEVSFHEGYLKAMKEVEVLLRKGGDLSRLQREIAARIAKAKSAGACSLASKAAGKAGY